MCQCRTHFHFVVTDKRLCLPHTCEQGIIKITMFQGCSTGFLLVGDFLFPQLNLFSRGISRERISNFFFEKKTSTVFKLQPIFYLHLPCCFCCYNMTNRPCQNAREGVYEDRYMVYQNLPTALWLLNLLMLNSAEHGINPAHKC